MCCGRRDNYRHTNDLGRHRIPVKQFTIGRSSIRHEYIRYVLVSDFITGNTTSIDGSVILYKRFTSKFANFTDPDQLATARHEWPTDDANHDAATDRPEYDLSTS